MTYKFPKDETTIITKMEIQVNEKVIEASIKEKKKAQNTYDDAVASGHTAALVKEDEEHTELLSLEIGTILPGQTIKVEIKMV